jgi:hypothetical protein
MDDRVLPDYGNACITGIVPALCGPGGTGALPEWFPEPARGAGQVVLVVLDGLGWDQLQQRRHLAPVLTSLEGGRITTVAPSTTATALTSIATGLTPGEHGVVGYRIAVQGEILNVLRWTTPSGDARRRIPPGDFQPIRPFLGLKAPVLSKAELATSGFTAAHLAGARQVGWRVPSTMIVDLRRALAAGEGFIYAYYDGIDKVAHEYGLGDHYDAELLATDRLIGEMLALLPPGAVLVVTADHGQVDVGEAMVKPAQEVLDLVRLQSGEARFRWLHARPGAVGSLLDAAREAHSGDAWVVSAEQVCDEGWLGPVVGRAASARLGDVAQVSSGVVSLDDPADTGPFPLVSRHGSLTPDEMWVPLLAGRAEHAPTTA